MCKSAISPSDDKDNGQNRIEFTPDKETLYHLFKDKFIRVQLEVDYNWTYESVIIPIEILAYEQDEYGTLAWLLEGGYESSRGYVSFKMPVTKLDDGNYLANQLDIQAPKGNLEIELIQGDS